ncbi:MAG: hypothetical protein IT329_22720 [Caldilineaceae bacterium]|nr:hypothetical protein [Caldilineaceae bacterium]
MTRPIYTLDDVIRQHEDAGGCFFSRGALRFFDSRTCAATLTISRRGRAFFVTSEQFHSPHGDRPRAYTVRVWDPTCPRSIDTVGDFQQYATYCAAARACLRAALADQ